MSTSPGPNLFNQLINRQINSKYGTLFPSMIFRERLKLAKSLFKTDLVGHYGCVNAIEFSYGGKYLASGGDDKRVLLWDVEKSLAGYSQPIPMDKEHQSNIFCLGFDKTNSKIFSGGNDELVIVHDFETTKVVDVFIHQKPVYGLSVDPTCDSILATASEDGKITIYDQRKSAAVQVFGKFGGSRQASFHAVQFHPYDGNFLVTANTKKGAAFWDIRSSSKPLIQYGGEENQKSCMSVRFNSNGTLVLALRRRLPPILYNTSSEAPICQFYHQDYYNSCTMKSCCFAGEDDEYVLSGSDDFNLYVWKVGDVDLTQSHQWIEKTQMILYGHRSIVNQVRYNYEKCLLASSGVEKIVKVWSPFKQKDWSGNLIDEATCSENPREVYSHDAYLSLANNMTHDYSTQNTQEDSRMMAFFDSLIQQEIEQWNTSNYSSDSCHSNESTDERSSIHSSTDESDENLNITSLFSNSRNRSRNNRINSATVKPQRNKYTNRIAYLIATKRNTLRRLALKGASNSRRRQNILKTKKKIYHRNHPGPGVRTSRSGNSQKRTGRYMNSASYRNRTNSNNSIHQENLELKLNRSKRYDTSFRNLRRKHRSRRHIDPSDSFSSSDNDNDSSNLESSRTVNIAIPSTSTGITSSGRDIIIRLRQQEQMLDSDFDDDDEETSNIVNRNSNNNNNVINNNNVNSTENVILNGHTNHTYSNTNGTSDVVNNSSHEGSSSGTSSSGSSSTSSSSSTIETDTDDRQNNNHFNNNTDIANNNLIIENSNNNNNNNNNNNVTTNIENNFSDESSDNNDGVSYENVFRKCLAAHSSSLGEGSSSSGLCLNNKKLKTTNTNTDIEKTNFTKTSKQNYDIYSSHSNSRLSNSDYLDDSSSFSNESLEDCYNGNSTSNINNSSSTIFKKRRRLSSVVDFGTSLIDTNKNNIKKNNNTGNENTVNTECDVNSPNVDENKINKSHNNKKYLTGYNRNGIKIKTIKKWEEKKSPKLKINGFSKTFIPITPDSGVTAGCSSATSSPGSAGHHKNINKNDRNNNSSIDNIDNNRNSDKFSIKLFNSKIARVRRNYRNKFGEDSDSD